MGNSVVGAGTVPRDAAVGTRKVIFVIPAYNEQLNITSLLEQTRAHMDAHGQPYDVLIIDDGSRDRTVELARAFAEVMPLRVISHDRNRGVGQVFRTGLQAALAMGRSGDIIVTKEADNTSDLAILPEMLRRIDEGYELVLASCYAPGGTIVGTTPLRMAVSQTANTVLKLFFPVGDRKSVV